MCSGPWERRRGGSNETKNVLGPSCPRLVPAGRTPSFTPQWDTKRWSPREDEDGTATGSEENTMSFLKMISGFFSVVALSTSAADNRVRPQTSALRLQVHVCNMAEMDTVTLSRAETEASLILRSSHIQ